VQFTFTSRIRLQVAVLWNFTFNFIIIIIVNLIIVIIYENVDTRIFSKLNSPTTGKENSLDESSGLVILMFLTNLRRAVRASKKGDLSTKDESYNRYLDKLEREPPDFYFFLTSLSIYNLSYMDIQ
jgi:hypothetical protein